MVSSKQTPTIINNNSNFGFWYLKIISSTEITFKKELTSLSPLYYKRIEIMTETSKSIVHMNFLKATTKITETSSITFSKVKT